jgi:Sulfotransferase family
MLDRRPAVSELGKTTGRYVSAMGWKSVNTHTHISLVNRYVYVEVPKAGCGSMKATLGGMEAARMNPPLVEAVQAHPHDRDRVTPFVKPYQLPSDELEKVFTSRKFTRFAVVREPASRLLSGYLEKIRQGLVQSGPIYQVLADQGRAPAKPEDISFEDFLDVVCALPSKQQDPHWRRQVDHLGFGTVKYDHIIKLSDLDASWPLVASIVGVPSLQEQFFCKFSTGASHKLNEHYTEALLAKVADAYAADYAAFGFTLPTLG